MRCECGTEMEFIGTNWICPKCSDVGKPVIVLPPGSKDFIKKKMAKMNAREEREELEKAVYNLFDTGFLNEEEQQKISRRVVDTILAKLPELVGLTMER